MNLRFRSAKNARRALRVRPRQVIGRSRRRHPRAAAHQEEEKRLIARLENLASLDDLRRMQERLRAQLGIVVRILPSDNEVRTTRGIFILLDEQPGLCRKTRSAIPAAIRRSFDTRPEIVYALLNERDLLAGA